MFRFLSQAIHLPHRIFYTPATEYKSVPSEFFHSSTEDRGAGKFGLHPIPSVIDLPSRAGVLAGGGGGLNEKARDEDELYTTLNDKEKDEQIQDENITTRMVSLTFFLFDNNTNANSIFSINQKSLCTPG